MSLSRTSQRTSIRHLTAPMDEWKQRGKVEPGSNGYNTLRPVPCALHPGLGERAHAQLTTSHLDNHSSLGPEP